MADGIVDPPSDNLGLTAGSGGSGSEKSKRNLIIGGVAAVGLVAVYLFAKSRSNAGSQSANTTAPPELITPANNADTYLSGLGTTLTNQNQQILAQEIANQSSFTNGLSSAITAIKGAIAGSQGATVTNMGSSGSAPVLPVLNPQDFPQIVKYGTYQPGQYTQIGTDVNGVYSGEQVSGNAPVYTGIFGGFAQGPFPRQGTYGVYIPTSLLQYAHN